MANGVPSPAFAVTLDYFALRARAELAAGARAVVYNVIRYKTDPEDEESIIIRGNDLRLAFHPNEDPAFKAAMVEVARNFVADQPSTSRASSRYPLSAKRGRCVNSAAMNAACATRYALPIASATIFSSFFERVRCIRSMSR
jgi:hypothetical protein